MPSVQHWVAICQPNFLPWLGYLEMIDRVDTFILFDDVQYVRREWVNRNRIPRVDAVDWQWISVPLQKMKRDTLIKDVVIASPSSWYKPLLKTLTHVYKKSDYFGEFYPQLESLLQENYEQLLDLNVALIRWLCSVFGISTPLVKSSSFEILDLKKSERLLEVCQRAGGTAYLANNGSKSYIDEALFARAGVEFQFQDYTLQNYRKIMGLHEYSDALSALDLLFLKGTLGSDDIRAGGGILGTTAQSRLVV